MPTLRVHVWLVLSVLPDTPPLERLTLALSSTVCPELGARGPRPPVTPLGPRPRPAKIHVQKNH